MESSVVSRNDSAMVLALPTVIPSLPRNLPERSGGVVALRFVPESESERDSSAGSE
jgi:hypothetical protein